MSGSGISLLRKPKKRPAPMPKESILEKSKNNAYVILLGQAESGKSTTLNKIFGDREISPVEREVGTDHVLEFTSNLLTGDISWIDAPGLGDINGLEWDARIISTLAKFRNSHEELKSAIPNVVLLFARFDDNRIQGDASSFVKMIKSIDSQRSNFLDQKHNNLIIVLTHAMNGKPSLRKDPEPRLQIVRSVLKSYARFPHEPQIVLAENEAEDQELEPFEDSHRLPNGEIYPQNLFDAILKICNDSGDRIGLRLFEEAFSQHRTEIAVELKRSLPLLPVEESQEIIPFLSHLYLSTRITVMFDQLNTKWSAMNKPLIEPGYQYFLNLLERNGYKTFETLPTNWETFKKLLVELEYDPSLTQLMESVLHISQPDRPPGGVGYSYSLNQDRILEKTPLELDNYEASPLLQKLPYGIKYFNEVDSSEAEQIFFYMFLNRSEYSEKRRNLLGLSNTRIECEGKIKSGFNVVEDFKLKKNQPIRSQSKDPSSQIITILKEFRVGLLTYTEPSDERICSDFQNAVGKLKPFNRRDRHLWKQWRELFSEYGTHLVTSAFMGGAIELTINCDLLKLELGFKELNIDDASLIELTLTPLFNFDNYTSAFPDYVQNVKLIGGNPQVLITGTNWLQLPYPAPMQCFKDWKSSLKYYPTLLTSSMRLIEIQKYMAIAKGLSPGKKLDGTYPTDWESNNSAKGSSQANDPVIASVEAAIQTLFGSVPTKGAKRGLACTIA